MRNKSRKRILHEQRVEIEKLRREIKAYQWRPRIWEEYAPQRLELKRYFNPNLSPAELEETKRRVDNEAAREIADAIISNGVIERMETQEAGLLSVRYTIRILKRRF